MKRRCAVPGPVMAAQRRSFMTDHAVMVAVATRANMPICAAITDMTPVPVAIAERAVADAWVIIAMPAIIVGVSVIGMHAGARAAVGVIALIIGVAYPAETIAAEEQAVRRVGILIDRAHGTDPVAQANFGEIINIPPDNGAAPAKVAILADLPDAGQHDE